MHGSAIKIVFLMFINILCCVWAAHRMFVYEYCRFILVFKG